MKRSFLGGLLIARRKVADIRYYFYGLKIKRKR